MQYRYSGDRVMNIAAIDIGTNSCRLLVSRVFINPQKRSYLKCNASPITWKSVDSFCRIVKLGEGLTKTGVLREKMQKITKNGDWKFSPKIAQNTN